MASRRAFLLIAPSLLGMCLAQNGNSTDSTFTITGQVRHPGKYNLFDGMLVSDALTPAGGLLESADDTKITVVRGRKRHRFNYRNYKLGKGHEDNIPLESGDVIVVN